MASTQTNPTTLKLQELLAENPVQTLKALGNQLGITRERVRQICESEQLDRKTPIISKRPFCYSCNKLLHLYNVSGLCFKHYWESNSAILTAFTCEGCGKPFQRKKGQVEAGHKAGNTIRWCSKKCQGKWLAQHYGFGARE